MLRTARVFVAGSRRSKFGASLHVDERDSSGCAAAKGTSISTALTKSADLFDHSNGRGGLRDRGTRTARAL